MKEFERLGVEIDRCPGCKGVWLDRGELDKLIALSQQGVPMPEPTPAATLGAVAGTGFLDQAFSGFGQGGHNHDHGQDRYHDQDRDRERHSHQEQERGYGPSPDRRRGSWLGDLFGGDD
jgi:Zn-finger nucleic acid-binding protein